MAMRMSRNRRADDEKAQLLARPHDISANLGALQDEQTLAGRERTPPEGDQASSDNAHDLAGGGDPEAHARNRDVRQRITCHRQYTARARWEAGAARDRLADAGDHAALTRDRAAAARDLVIAKRDIADQHAAHAPSVSGAEIVMRAALAMAARDREAAAGDRELAAGERRHALADRDALEHHVAIIETDALTGARTRTAGLIDLDRPGSVASSDEDFRARSRTPALPPHQRRARARLRAHRYRLERQRRPRPERRRRAAQARRGEHSRSPALPMT